MNNTKENILDVAECLFAANGFAGTSIRAIVDGANVNIAAINYHFKSKERLFVEVIRRRFKEIEAIRFSLLDSHLEQTDNTPTLEGVVRAFLEPLKNAFETNYEVPMMLIRAFCENDELKELIRPICDDTRERFFKVLGRVFEDKDETEVKWRFQYMISSMVGLIIFADEIQENIAIMPGKQDIIEKLIHQIIEGIKA